MDVIPYLVYFLGPLVLAWLVGRRWLGASWHLLWIGLVAFLAAWTCVMIATIGATAAGIAITSFWFALIVSTGAGVFEESARYGALWLAGRRRVRVDANGGLMYAIGHSGMESWITGGSVLLTVIVVTHFPEALSSEELLAGSRAVAEAPMWEHLYGAFERLFVGLLIHACFTCLVVLALRRRQVRFLGLAIAWHFGHDMVAFNLHRVSSGPWMHAAWIGFILVAYGAALVFLWRILARGSGAAAPSSPPPAPPVAEDSPPAET